MRASCRIPKLARKKPQFDSLPTATGGIARAAYAWAERRLDIAPLLKRSGVTVQQIKNPRIRMAVKKKIKVLNLSSEFCSPKTWTFANLDCCITFWRRPTLSAMHCGE